MIYVRHEWGYTMHDARGQFGVAVGEPRAVLVREGLNTSLAKRRFFLHPVRPAGADGPEAAKVPEVLGRASHGRHHAARWVGEDLPKAG